MNIPALLFAHAMSCGYLSDAKYATRLSKSCGGITCA